MALDKQVFYIGEYLQHFEGDGRLSVKKLFSDTELFTHKANFYAQKKSVEGFKAAIMYAREARVNYQELIARCPFKPELVKGGFVEHPMKLEILRLRKRLLFRESVYTDMMHNHREAERFMEQTYSEF